MYTVAAGFNVEPERYSRVKQLAKFERLTASSTLSSTIIKHALQVDRFKQQSQPKGRNGCQWQPKQGFLPTSALDHAAAAWRCCAAVHAQLQREDVPAASGCL